MPMMSTKPNTTNTKYIRQPRDCRGRFVRMSRWQRWMHRRTWAVSDTAMVAVSVAAMSLWLLPR